MAVVDRTVLGVRPRRCSDDSNTSNIVPVSSTSVAEVLHVADDAGEVQDDIGDANETSVTMLELVPWTSNCVGLEKDTTPVKSQTPTSDRVTAPFANDAVPIHTPEWLRSEMKRLSTASTNRRERVDRVKKIIRYLPDSAGKRQKLAQLAVTEASVLKAKEDAANRVAAVRAKRRESGEGGQSVLEGSLLSSSSCVVKEITLRFGSAKDDGQYTSVSGSGKGGDRSIRDRTGNRADSSVDLSMPMAGATNISTPNQITKTALTRGEEFFSAKFFASLKSPSSSSKSYNNDNRSEPASDVKSIHPSSTPCTPARDVRVVNTIASSSTTTSRGRSGSAGNGNPLELDMGLIDSLINENMDKLLVSRKKGLERRRSSDGVIGRAVGSEKLNAQVLGAVEEWRDDFDGKLSTTSGNAIGDAGAIDDFQRNSQVREHNAQETSRKSSGRNRTSI